MFERVTTTTLKSINECGEYTITKKAQGMTAYEFIADLVVPLMLAHGYHIHSIYDAIEDYMEEVISLEKDSADDSE